jgi:hypothetical protein
VVAPSLQLRLPTLLLRLPLRPLMPRLLPLRLLTLLLLLLLLLLMLLRLRPSRRSSNRLLLLMRTGRAGNGPSGCVLGRGGTSRFISVCNDSRCQRLGA